MSSLRTAKVTMNLVKDLGGLLSPKRRHMSQRVGMKSVADIKSVLRCTESKRTSRACKILSWKLGHGDL
eukprot:jgi/Antlo1/911/1741